MNGIDAQRRIDGIANHVDRPVIVIISLQIALTRAAHSIPVVAETFRSKPETSSRNSGGFKTSNQGPKPNTQFAKLDSAVHRHRQDSSAIAAPGKALSGMNVARSKIGFGLLVMNQNFHLGRFFLQRFVSRSSNLK